MEVYNINFNDVIQSLFNKIGVLENGINGAMPMAGGTFTGTTFANSTNRTDICLRNISISKDSKYMETDRIIMQRK
jgi:hypothetical protein